MFIRELEGLIPKISKIVGKLECNVTLTSEREFSEFKAKIEELDDMVWDEVWRVLESLAKKYGYNIDISTDGSMPWSGMGFSTAYSYIDYVFAGERGEVARLTIEIEDHHCVPPACIYYHVQTTVRDIRVTTPDDC